jgi:hypothetical protein
LVDDWRARGFYICAKELEAIVNAGPRAGVWVTAESLDKAEKRADDKADRPHHKHENFDPEGLNI